MRDNSGHLRNCNFQHLFFDVIFQSGPFTLCCLLFVPSCTFSLYAKLRSCWLSFRFFSRIKEQYQLSYLPLGMKTNKCNQAQLHVTATVWFKQPLDFGAVRKMMASRLVLLFMKDGDKLCGSHAQSWLLQAHQMGQLVQYSLVLNFYHYHTQWLLYQVHFNLGTRRSYRESSSRRHHLQGAQEVCRPVPGIQATADLLPSTSNLTKNIERKVLSHLCTQLSSAADS